MMSIVQPSSWFGVTFLTEPLYLQPMETATRFSPRHHTPASRFAEIGGGGVSGQGRLAGTTRAAAGRQGDARLLWGLNAQLPAGPPFWPACRLIGRR